MRDRALGSTVRIYFTTHTLSTGVVVAPSSAFVAADFKIYKNGSATEKATTNGITVTSPFDSVAGTHLIEIDTSNTTGDSGFWAVGSEYRVVMSTAKTVDSKNPSGICAGEFSLELQTIDATAILAKLPTTGRAASQESVDALGSGTGARTVTITVNDGSTVLQNARVRLTEGANTFSGLTNASGVVTFNLDDATYAVAITKSGYSYAGTTLVVDGTEAVTYSMTETSITPPDGPTKTVLTILCLDENGDADSGISVSIRYVSVPTDSMDIAFYGASITKTSNGIGVATFQVIKGATIEYKRGTRDVWLEAVMSDEDTTSITSFIGTP